MSVNIAQLVQDGNVFEFHIFRVWIRYCYDPVEHGFMDFTDAVEFHEELTRNPRYAESTNQESLKALAQEKCKEGIEESRKEKASLEEARRRARQSEDPGAI